MSSFGLSHYHITIYTTDYLYWGLIASSEWNSFSIVSTSLHFKIVFSLMEIQNKITLILEEMSSKEWFHDSMFGFKQTHWIVINNREALLEDEIYHFWTVMEYGVCPAKCSRWRNKLNSIEPSQRDRVAKYNLSVLSIILTLLPGISI